MTARQRGAVGEAGVATVMALAWIVVVTTLAWIAMLAAAATARQHRVDGAAELAAVSAATRLQRGGDACATAKLVATRNEVSLQECHIEGRDVVVTVVDELSLPLAIRRQLLGNARAGPADR